MFFDKRKLRLLFIGIAGFILSISLGFIFEVPKLGLLGVMICAFVFMYGMYIIVTDEDINSIWYWLKIKKRKQDEDS